MADICNDLAPKVDNMFPKDILKDTKLGQTMTSGHRPLTKIHRNWNQNISLEPKNITGANKYHQNQKISLEPKNISGATKYHSQKNNHFRKISPGRSQGPADPAVAPYRI